MNTTNTTSKTAQLDDYDLYCTVRQIADQIQAIARKHGIWFVDYRNENGASPSEARTADGLFVHVNYAGPKALITPWGRWLFIGSSTIGVWDKAWKEIAELLGAKAIPGMSSSTNTSSYVPFAVTRCGNKRLPNAVALSLDKFSHSSCRDADAAWDKLTKRYQSENPV